MRDLVECLNECLRNMYEGKRTEFTGGRYSIKKAYEIAMRENKDVLDEMCKAMLGRNYDKYIDSNYDRKLQTGTFREQLLLRARKDNRTFRYIRKYWKDAEEFNKELLHNWDLGQLMLWVSESSRHYDEYGTEATILHLCYKARTYPYFDMYFQGWYFKQFRNFYCKALCPQWATANIDKEDAVVPIIISDANKEITVIYNHSTDVLECVVVATEDGKKEYKETPEMEDILFGADADINIVNTFEKVFEIVAPHSKYNYQKSRLISIRKLKKETAKRKKPLSSAPLGSEERERIATDQNYGNKNYYDDHSW